LVLAPVLAATSGACSGETGAGGPLVVATHSILGDLAREVVGRQAEVEVIMGPGTDAHDFEPSAADRALLLEADVVLANGLGFEAGLLDTLEAAEQDGANVVELGPDLDPLAFDEQPGQPEAVEDPHWFTDPQRAATAVALIADAVVQASDEVDADTIQERATAYHDEVLATDAAIEQQLGAIAADARLLVTNHEVFGYFADRYGFEVIATIIPSGTTLAEPSSGEVADLVDTIERTDAPAIFTDTSSSDALAETIAAETDQDVDVVPLFTESLGDEGSGGETYLELIQTNAERITAALS